LEQGTTLLFGLSGVAIARVEVMAGGAREVEVVTTDPGAARGGHRHEINARLYDFYTWCADAELPELTTLAQTIQTRQVKHIKRAGYGFRNRSNYRHRVRLHWTRSTRPRPA
jgi:hypothetical protein